MNPEIGIIEGYYGRHWSWQERAETISWLAPHGYRFYLYAPKADPHLRRLWREPHPDEVLASMASLSADCRSLGVRFGIGLSPMRIHHSFDDDARAVLAAKLAQFDAVGIDDLAILFDDMRADRPNLADLQAQIAHWAAGRTSATRVIVCPSYYTDDPVLDRVFGARPPGYVERLGEVLDPGIGLFWTGEEVCSREFSAAHLERVTAQLRRKPFIWDNYPVNDGERMSQFLHLRAFTGRPAAMGGLISAHGINPALQPTLTRIPALTLADSYRLGAEYQYLASFRAAARQVLGDELGEKVYEDLLILQDIGLDRLDEKAATLRERYGGIDHAGAREIIAWLDGEYRITDEIIAAQSGE